MKRISTYRDALMGIAILWIVLFHAEVTFPLWLRPLTWLKEAGYGGVDIFLFLSGLGLYFSMAKDARTGRFFRNRLVRILPTYWTIILAAAAMEYVLLHRRTPWLELFYMVSTLGFWLNATKFDWYIPSLLALYAMFPVYFHFFRRSRHKQVVPLLAVAISWAFSGFVEHHGLNYLLIFTLRIPVFFAGAYYGYMIREGLRWNIWVEAAVSVVGLVWLGYVFKTESEAQRWLDGDWWYPFLLITPGLCDGLAWVLGRIGRTAHMHVVRSTNGGALASGGRFVRVLEWFGRYSLEIYLVHTLVFGLHKETGRYFAFDPSGVCAYLVYFIVTLPLAFLLHRVMAYVTRWLTKPETHV